MNEYKVYGNRYTLEADCAMEVEAMMRAEAKHLILKAFKVMHEGGKAKLWICYICKEGDQLADAVCAGPLP